MTLKEVDMKDEHDENNVDIDEMLDQTQLMFGDIAPLKNPHKQKSKADEVPTGIRFTLDDGREIKIMAGDNITLGRNDRANDNRNLVDLNPYDAKKQGVSRSHALLSITKKGVFIKDLDSTNGTFINGQQLYPMRKYALADGDEVTPGYLVMKITFIF